MSLIPHANVIIATPGHSLSGAYNKSLMKTLDELNRRGYNWVWTNEYSSHVGDAREVTLSGTYHNSYTQTKPLEGKVTYDKIMWIDSDISWNVDDFFKLLDSDKDIITGAYLLGTGEVTVYKKYLSKGYSHQEVMSMTDLIKVASCGFGFLCVKSGVFESLERPWFQAAYDTIVDEKTGQTTKIPILGEDIAWCKRVADLGYEIWFDPTVKVTHHKTMKLTWEGVTP